MNSAESDFIALMRNFARDPAARGLLDDAAVIAIGGENLVLTHDMIVEGVHFLPSDPPADIGWKLAAVNLSDLAAKGAAPRGCLLGYALSGDAAWDAAFAGGLAEALDRYACPLLGGDTVAAPAGAPRGFGLTAIGTSGHAPSRSGAQPGDTLWLGGPVGDAGIGLMIARGERTGPAALLAAYRRPVPQLDLGRRIAPRVHAMMDVSDGLLIDAARLAAASGARVTIDLARIPLSRELRSVAGDSSATRIAAASAGDDYVLLAAGPGDLGVEIEELTAIGSIGAGEGLRLVEGNTRIPLPRRLGYEHEPL